MAILVGVPVRDAMPEGCGEVLDDGPYSYEEAALGSVHTQALGGDVGRLGGEQEGGVVVW